MSVARAEMLTDQRAAAWLAMLPVGVREGGEGALSGQLRERESRGSKS